MSPSFIGVVDAQLAMLGEALLGEEVGKVRRSVAKLGVEEADRHLGDDAVAFGAPEGADQPRHRRHPQGRVGESRVGGAGNGEQSR